MSALRGALGLALVLACACGAEAQGWTRLLDAPSVVPSIASTSDGGVVLAGRLGAPWLMKLDADGAVEWQKEYVDPVFASDGRVRQALDGGYYVAGEGNFGAAWLAKLDSSGDVERATTLTFAGFADLAALADGGVIVVGKYTGQYCRFDASGTMLRRAQIFAGTTCGFESVAPAPDGGALIAGVTQYQGDIWLVRVDAAGDVVEQRVLPATSMRVVVAPTADGGFVCATWAMGGATRVTRLAADLSVVWTSELDVAASVRVNSVCELSDGAIAIAAAGVPLWVGAPQVLAVDATVVAALEPTGGMRWSRAYDSATNATGLVAPTPGGLFLGTNLAIRRLDSDGLAGATCHGDIVPLDIDALVSTGGMSAIFPAVQTEAPFGTALVPVVSAAAGRILAPGDSHEPDDACGAGRALAEGVVPRDFCDDAEDWHDLIACAGSTYEIATSSLGPMADTRIELYSPDCLSLLASDDDGGGGRASRLSWSAPADGTYRVLVRQADGSSGFDRDYDLSLSLSGPGCGTWRRDFEIPLPRNLAEGCALTSPGDGRLVLAGRAWRPGSYAEAFVTTLDPSGAIVQHEQHAHRTRLEWDGITATTELPGGGRLLAGSCGDPLGAFVRVVDAGGVIAWERAYDTGGRRLGVRRVLALPGGGFAVVGAVRAVSSNLMEPWIMRIDDAGSILWSVELVADHATAGSDGVVTDDGALLIASPESASGGLLLTKLRLDGGPAWQRLHSLTADGWLAAATRTVDGGIVVAAGDTILRLDGTGELVWSRMLGDASAWLRGRSIAAAEDGGVVVGGSRRSNPSGDLPMLVRLDASGEVEWQRVANDAALQFRPFVCVTRTPDRGFAAIGSTDQEMVVVKVDGAGELRGDCVLDDAGLVVSPGRRDAAVVRSGAFVLNLSTRLPELAPVDRSLVATPKCGGGPMPPLAEDCFNGADDDGDALVDCLDDSCATSDVDGDGAPDCIDCSPFDEGSRDVPGEVEDLRVVKVVPDGFMVHLTWSDSVSLAAGDGTVYDVTSGSIATLHASGWSAPATCVGNDVAQLDRYDLRPLVTECWWLVRAENACATGPWGGIAAPEPDCP